MYKITKAINKFSDELDAWNDGGEQELTHIFAKALIADARDNGELLDETDETAGGTTRKYTPSEWDVRTVYVTALKDSFAIDRDEGDEAFDRFIEKVKSDDQAKSI